MKSKIQDYTENEFIEFMVLIFKENTALNDDKLDALLEKFELLTEYPDGTDLIYYPDNEANCSPEGITKIIKEWRISQGLPLFKAE